MKIAAIVLTVLLGVASPFATAADGTKQKGLRGAQPNELPQDLDLDPIEISSKDDMQERKLQASTFGFSVQNKCHKDMWVYVWWENIFGKHGSGWQKSLANGGSLWGYSSVVNPVIHIHGYVSNEEHWGTISSQPTSDYCVQSGDKYYCGMQMELTSTGNDIVRLELTCPNDEQLPVPPSVQTPAPTPAQNEDRIDTSNRRAVVQAYNQRFKAPSLGEQSDMKWTGNLDTCAAGNTSLEFQKRVIGQVNFYRNMAGLASVDLETDNTIFQKSSLIMRANQQLSHHPTSSWKCYSTEGAEGASSSNLFQWTDQGVGIGHGIFAIDNYMEDPGSSNNAARHRRNILHPQSKRFATGDVPGANSLARLDDSGSATQTEFVAWPSKGYFPYDLMPFHVWEGFGLWKWSFGVDNASFSQAQVSVKNMKTGESYNIEVVARDHQYGYINSIVFKPHGFSHSKPTQDTEIRVDVTGVIVDNVSKDYHYTVTIFDPESEA